MSKIIFSQSVWLQGLLDLLLLSGDNGKQEPPGKSGFLSQMLGKFSCIIDKSSANIQPTAQTSIGSPQSFSKSISSGALYHLVTTCPVSYLFKPLLASLLLIRRSFSCAYLKRSLLAPSNISLFKDYSYNLNSSRPFFIFFSPLPPISPISDNY